MSRNLSFVVARYCQTVSSLFFILFRPTCQKIRFLWAIEFGTSYFPGPKSDIDEPLLQLFNQQPTGVTFVIIGAQLTPYLCPIGARRIITFLLNECRETYKLSN